MAVVREAGFALARLPVVAREVGPVTGYRPSGVVVVRGVLVVIGVSPWGRLGSRLLVVLVLWRLPKDLAEDEGHRL